MAANQSTPHARSIPQFVHRIRTTLPPLLALLVVPGALHAQTTTPGPVAHDMYVCVSMTKGFVIGGVIQQRSGIYRSTDRVAVEHVGFNHPRQDGLAWNPRDPATFFTVGLNGVLRTTDDGATWRIMTGWDMTEPKDIAIDPAQPDHLYIGLPDGIGVSRDAGATWRRMNAGIERSYTQTIVVDRTRTGRIVAGTELGIYVSDDAARTWKLARESRATVTDIRQSPHDPERFLASTQSDGAWLSTDGARTWKTLTGAPAEVTLHNCDFDASDPSRLLLSGWGCGVVVSEDGGTTWHARNDGLPNTEVWRASFDPDVPGRVYASPHQEAVYSSDDYGRTWKPLWFEGAVVWEFVFKPRQPISAR
jgi:hypothetical protein